MNLKLLLIFLCLGCGLPAFAQNKDQGSTKGGKTTTTEPKVRHRKASKTPKPLKSPKPAEPIPEPEPAVREASLFFVDSFFKKDRVREVSSSGFVLSPLGEAFIYRNELKRGKPYRQWLLYRKEDCTFYVVDPLAETAVRTPKIIFPQSLKAPAEMEHSGKSTRQLSFVDTMIDEDRILGYKTEKYARLLNDGSRLEQWIATELTFPLSACSRMSAALNKFRLPDNPEYGEHAGCFVFREKKYDSEGKLVYSRNLNRFDMEHAEQRFFDLRGFGITDILTGWVVKDPEPEVEKKRK